MDDIYQYCRELLEYIDPAGEIVHARGCRPGQYGCTCDLETTINNILMDLEIYESQS